MLTALRIDSTRFLHMTIIALQIFSVAQVVWWFVDQQSYAEQTTAQIKALYSYEMAAAQKLLDLGASVDEVTDLFPHAQTANGQIALAPGTIEELEDEQGSHVNQYAWESGFFLFVLASCIAVLWRGLSNEANIRKRQDNFLAMVSHQFKTPLASLQLSLETMLMREFSPERFQQLTRRMLDDLRRMENMVSKILDSARLDRGRVQLNRERVNLCEAVRHVLSNLEDPARRENIELKSNIPPNIEVHADPMAVDTVLRNLIENAMAAMAPNKGGTATISARQMGEEIELEVRDTGIGFELEQSGRLFEKFFKVESHGGRDAAGTGLGLYIVTRFMHFEHGKVRAHSDGPGKGAAFTVTWHATQGQAA